MPAFCVITRERGYSVFSESGGIPANAGMTESESSVQAIAAIPRGVADNHGLREGEGQAVFSITEKNPVPGSQNRSYLSSSI